MKTIIKYLNKVKEVENEIFLVLKTITNDEKKKDDYIACYRGEDQIYPKPNTPSMYRYGYNINDLLDSIEELKISESESDFHKMIDAQHHIGISNLLDISFDILVSLYFACCNIEDESINFKETNAKVMSCLDRQNFSAILNGNKDVERKCTVGNGALYCFLFPKSFIATKNTIEQDIRELRSGQNAFRYARKQNFRLINNTNLNSRIISQSGGFLYFYDTKESSIPDMFMGKIEINCYEKSRILYELDRYFNVNRSTIYPEKINQNIKVRKILNNKNGDYISGELDLILKEIEISKELLFLEIYKEESMIHGKSDLTEFFLKIDRIKRYYDSSILILSSNVQSNNKNYDYKMIKEKTNLIEEKFQKKIEEINQEYANYKVMMKVKWYNVENNQ